MKTNIFSRIAVTTMTVALGAGVIGAVSGTFAWFQYSTRSTVAYEGTAAHSTENLEIRVWKDGQAADAGWVHDLASTAINAKIKEAASVSAKITKQIGITGVSITDNGVKAKSVLPAGYNYLHYDGGWKKSDDSSVNLEDLGIAVTGTAATGDTIQIAYNDGTILSPVTSGSLSLGEFPSVLSKDPIYQYAESAKWGYANLPDYVDIPLEFRVQDVDGNADSAKRALLAKKIYLSDLTIVAKSVSGKQDISDAVRFAISNPAEDHVVSATYTSAGITNVAVTAADFNTKVSDATGIWTFTYFTTGATWKLNGVSVDLNDYGVTVTGTPDDGDQIFVKANAAGRTYAKTATSTDVYGNLDLNKDGTLDQEHHYDFDGTTPATVVYGDNGQSAKTNVSSVKATDASTLDIADDSDPYNIKGKELGTTVAAADGSAATSFLKLDLRIYLEGWQKLGTTPSALWSDADYVGSKFNIGLRFTAEAHEGH